MDGRSVRSGAQNLFADISMAQDKEKKRQIIRDAATKLFVQKGFENTTTRDISSAAGISKSAPYYYFDSKEELLFQILDETITKGLNLIKEIEDSGISLKEKFNEIIGLYTKYYTTDMNRLRLLANEQKSLSPEHQKILNNKQKEYVKVFVRILDSLKEQVRIVDFNTTVTAFAFFGMVHWIYRWYDLNGPVKLPELSKIFHHIFTKGIYVDE